jgi:hypothetical protein
VAASVTWIPWEGARSVELQIAALRSAACAVYGSSGAAVLSLLARVPVFALQSLALRPVFRHRWNDRESRLLRIHARHPPGPAHFDAPCDEAFGAFARYWRLWIRPSPEVAAQRRLAGECVSLLDRFEFEAAARMSESPSIVRIPELPYAGGVAHAALGNLDRATRLLAEAFELDSGDELAACDTFDRLVSIGRIDVADEHRQRVLSTVRCEPALESRDGACRHAAAWRC